LCISNLYNILCTVNTQHTSSQDAVIRIRLYLATCFGRNRPSSGQLRTILMYSKNITQWDPISLLYVRVIWDNFLVRHWRLKKISAHFCTLIFNFDVLLTVHLSIFISVISQLDVQDFCFTISLFHASTCFEHLCSSSRGQNCITQPLVSSHL